MKLEQNPTFKWSSEGELVLEEEGSQLDEKAMVVLGSDPNWWGSEYLEEPPVWTNLAGGIKGADAYTEEIQENVRKVLEANDITVENLQVLFENDILTIESDH